MARRAKVELLRLTLIVLSAAAVLLPCRIAAADRNAAPARAVGGAETEADRAWKQLEALRLPEDPAEWATRPPTDEQRQEHRKRQAEFAARASDAARDFYTRFPGHDMAPVAKTVESRFLQPFKAEVLAHRVEQIEKRAAKQQAAGGTTGPAEMEKGARDLLAEFPDHFVPNQFLLKIAAQLQGPRARLLAEEVRTTKGVPDFVKEEAADLLKKLDAVGSPMSLKFLAVDGREVDLERLRGSVVLLDFWATWCVPCVQGLPELKAVYEKFHPRGFEIVGISLDEDRKALLDFVAKEKLAWPQYFDGKGWTNRFGQEFGIRSIPTLWLLDRRGVLRDLNARASLESKVGKLLAESP